MVRAALEERILELMGDGRSWKVSDLYWHVGRRYAQIGAILRALEKTGRVRRVEILGASWWRRVE